MMNRREALAALMPLPAAVRISVAKLKPNDVIVVECDEYLTAETAARIRQHLHEFVWPDHKIVVCEKGMHIKIASETGGR